MSSMLHRGGDMAMQGLTCRTPSVALWLDSHQTKRAMDDSYDVLRPPMLDNIASRPTFDLGLAADTSRETGPGDVGRVVRREGGCSAGPGPAETYRATMFRALVTSVRPRSSHVMLDCVGGHISVPSRGTLSCSSASADLAASLAVHAAPGAACTSSSSPRASKAVEAERVPRRVTSSN